MATSSTRCFRVMLRGQNFLLNIEGWPRRYGFYATRYVEAEDEAVAELDAVAMVRDEPDLKNAILNERGDDPMLYRSEIQEIKFLPSQETGRTFFPEDEDPDVDGSIGEVVTLKPRAG